MTAKEVVRALQEFEVPENHNAELFDTVIRHIPVNEYQEALIDSILTIQKASP